MLTSVSPWPGVLLDGSSWALLYRPLIFPAPGRKQAEIIYAKVGLCRSTQG